MRLTPPSQAVWLISLILGILGILAFLGVIPPLAAYAFWMVAIAFILLAVATALKGI